LNIFGLLQTEVSTSQATLKEKRKKSQTAPLLSAAWWTEKRGKKSNARKMSQTKTEAIGHILSA